MRILFLNRRDRRNPQGGGAEVYTHEVATGLVRAGHEVTLFASAYAGGASEEVIDGIRHIRRGGELTSHFYGFAYMFSHRHEYEVIVDQFNGLGFGGFLFMNSMLIVHQMYREFWMRELGVAGWLPYFIEPVFLRRYRKVPTVVVSDSTRRDLQELGFRDLHVVMNALSNECVAEVPQKEAAPTLVFLGRMRSTKQPDHALRIFQMVREQVPDAVLWMLGSGPDEAELRKSAEGIEGITFFGRVESELKFELLRRAHVLIVPGLREGFGINVIEAASMGTPAVGYDIHGLRDSIVEGETGLLAHDPAEAARLVVRLLGGDRQELVRLSEGALRRARGFVWSARAQEFRALVERIFTKTGDR